MAVVEQVNFTPVLLAGISDWELTQLINRANSWANVIAILPKTGYRCGFWVDDRRFR